MDQALLNKLREVVEANLDNEQFSVENLAASVAYSRSHLHRKLTSLTGRSISQFIRTIRLEHGLEMLKGDVGTVSEISFRVGFGSSTYFIKCFSDEFGFSPGEVKKKMAEGWFEKPGITPETESTETDQLTQPNPVSTPLEVLHPAASESLVREIFDALLSFKPSLQKYLEDEDDYEEAVDIRLLAYQIIKSYPWPIGVELRRLFSAALIMQGPERNAQLHKSVYRTLKVLAFILLAEITLRIHRKTLITQRDERELFEKIITNPDEKIIVDFLETGIKLIKDSPDKVFVEEFSSHLDEGFFLELKDWLELTKVREENISSQELTEMNQALEQILILLLKKSAFLVKYRMVSIRSIRLRKSLFKQARFEHRFHLLNSSDSDFRVLEEWAENYSDSNAVLLLKSLKTTDSFLNLSPLIIDTQHEDLTPVEKKAFKRDIYLLERFEEGKLVYSGTEYTGTEVPDRLEQYNELVEACNTILKLLRV